MSDQTTPEPSEQPAAHLDYARRPPLAWVSRHRRLLIVLAVLIAIAIPIVSTWRSLKHRVIWTYWSRRAAAFAMPAQPTEIFIDDAQKAAAALASDPASYEPNGTSAIHVPHTFRQLALSDSRFTLLSAGAWGNAVVFMGTLHRLDGTPRLVFITGGTGLTSNLMRFSSVLVLPIPGWFDPLPPPPGTIPPPSRGFGYSGPPPTPTRLKTATRDPKDPTHLVLEFDAGPRGSGFPFRTPTARWTVSASGIIDAHLQNDDSISFTLREFSGRDPSIHVGRPQISGEVQGLILESQKQLAARSARGTTQPAIRSSPVRINNDR